MTDVYLAPARSGRGFVLVDVDTGEVRLLAMGLPQAWLAASAQGWHIVQPVGRKSSSDDRRVGETISDWGTRLLLHHQQQRHVGSQRK